MWGSEGSGDGEFSSPWSVAVDASGSVYVVDNTAGRVQKFTAEFTSTGAFVATGGTQGFGAGQFSAPMGVATDGGDRVYVADTGNHRIQVFGPTPRPDGRIKLGCPGGPQG